MSKADIEISKHLQAIAGGLEKAFEEITGTKDTKFSLVVYSSDKGGKSNYVANGRREDLVLKATYFVDRDREATAVGTVQGYKKYGLPYLIDMCKDVIIQVEEAVDGVWADTKRIH